MITMNSISTAFAHDATTIFPFHVPAPATRDFYQLSKLEALVQASQGAIRFKLNQIINGSMINSISPNKPFLSTGSAIRYWAGRDEDGVLRGGAPQWAYMENLCDPSLSDQEKFKVWCKMLADLPANVSFGFKAVPFMADSHVVRAAFGKAGFTNIQRKTFLFRGNIADGDPIARLKSDARTKVNSARRDLEMASMDVDGFFDFYQENLVNYGGRKGAFSIMIDRETMKLGLGNIEILAVRRKRAEGAESDSPIEAAILCGWDVDGYYKLMRVTYRNSAEHNNGIDPHKHALKMLVVEAMKRATEKGLVLDVDGATGGGSTVYQRFGVFEEVLHDEFKRKTADTFICKFCNPMAIEKAAKSVKSALGRLLAFTVPAVMFYS